MAFGFMEVNGLIQGIGETSTTQRYNAGALVMDKDYKIYRYVYGSAIISANVFTEMYSFVPGTTAKVATAGVASTLLVDGGLAEHYVPAGNWFFALIDGEGDAYVASSITTGTALAHDATTGGTLRAHISAFSDPIAKALSTTTGIGAVVSVRVCVRH